MGLKIDAVHALSLVIELKTLILILFLAYVPAPISQPFLCGHLLFACLLCIVAICLSD